MARRFSLPLTLDPPIGRSAEAVRTKLGGRGASDAGVGEIVTLTLEGGMHLSGVVVFVQGDDLFVLLDGGAVRRARREQTRPSAAPSPEMVRIAADARVFASLHEGQRVRWHEPDGALRDGTIAEKCRYGAIVLAGEGKVLGVGFRKIWPVTEGDAPPS